MHNDLPCAEVFNNAKSEQPAENKIVVVISSDKGLCGGIHSSVTKATRKIFAAAPDAPLKTELAPETPIFIIGDKSKAQLSRALPKNLRMTFNQIGKDVPTFSDASAVTDLIIKSGVPFDSVIIVYNKFVSAISYEAAAVEVKGEKALKEAGEWNYVSTTTPAPYRVLRRRLQGLRDGG